jgi:hypothetical protein
MQPVAAPVSSYLPPPSGYGGPSSYPPIPDTAPLPPIAPGRQTLTQAHILPPPGPRQPLRDCLHSLHLCCWSHMNFVGCGNAKSECTFIFGSCRDFYGEPCRTGPPPFPVPPGYGYAAPDGYAPQGCGCE